MKILTYQNAMFTTLGAVMMVTVLVYIFPRTVTSDYIAFAGTLLAFVCVVLLFKIPEDTDSEEDVK